MFHALNSLLAVGSLLGDNLVLFQNGADDLHIPIIVLCYQNPFSREKKGLFLAQLPFSHPGLPGTA